MANGRGMNVEWKLQFNRLDGEEWCSSCVGFFFWRNREIVSLILLVNSGNFVIRRTCTCILLFGGDFSCKNYKGEIGVFMSILFSFFF